MEEATMDQTNDAQPVEQRPVEVESKRPLDRLPQEAQQYVRELREEAAKTNRRLKEAENRLRQLEEERKAAEIRALEEQGNYRAALEKERAENQARQAAFEMKIKDQAIKLAMAQAGAIDPDISAMIDRDKIKMESLESDVMAAVMDLKARKPKLFQDQSAVQEQKPAEQPKSATGAVTAPGASEASGDFSKVADVRSLSKSDYERFKAEQLQKVRSAWGR